MWSDVNCLSRNIKKRRDLQLVTGLAPCWQAFIKGRNMYYIDPNLALWRKMWWWKDVVEERLSNMGSAFSTRGVDQAIGQVLAAK